MSHKGALPIQSCWVLTEGLAGLRNQAIGLAQALGVPYVLKEIKKPRGLRKLFPYKLEFTAPWPDLLITCGCQSVAAAVAVRRASQKKTFTVHIQDPQIGPNHFDVVIAPAHDKVRGENVFITQGSVHHVNQEKLEWGREHFQSLLSALPRPLISVLVGGKNRHKGFTVASAHDFAMKLRQAVNKTGGALAISFSRRTGASNEAIIRQELAGRSTYIWDGSGENLYFGLLGLADGLVVTGDSVSMISEAVSTGKPVYIYELPHAGGRHKQFVRSLVASGVARIFNGSVEPWAYTPLDETRKAADFVSARYTASMSGSR